MRGRSGSRRLDNRGGGARGDATGAGGGRGVASAPGNSRETGSDTEPSKVDGLVDGDCVADTRGRVGADDDGAAVQSVGVAGLRVVLNGLGWGLGQAEDIGPLLDLFAEVGIVQSGVGSSVPDHELRTRSCVARVRGPNFVTLGHDELAHLARAYSYCARTHC